MRLRGSVTFVAELGTTSAFRFAVVDGDGSVAAGSTQTLTVLPADAQVRATLMAHQAPELVVVTLARLHDGEDYRTAAITGLVDETYTSWALESVSTACD